MAELPSHDLQLKAAEDRKRLHNSVAELRSRVHQDLRLEELVRARLGPICAVSAAVGLSAGYLITGAFVRH